MLSLSICREILGRDVSLPDEALELLRDQLYGLAYIIASSFIEQHFDHRRENDEGIRSERLRSGVGLQESVTLQPRDEREELEERAAILEFDGGIARNHAERIAFGERYRRGDV